MCLYIEVDSREKQVRKSLSILNLFTDIKKGAEAPFLA